MFRVKSEHPDLYSFAELKYDKKKFSSITFETIKSDLKAKDWPAFRSGWYVFRVNAFLLSGLSDF